MNKSCQILTKTGEENPRT